MINVPEIVKAQRDLTGQLAITFKDDEGKEFVKAFSELRAGISWPIRALPGYMAILGLYSGAVFGKPDSLMLLYEKEYSNSIELMTDAYNRANDLRFQLFYTNRQKAEWDGFNYEFQRKIRGGLGSRDIRLNHSPFAADFMMGKDTIKRLAQEKALHIPTASLFMRQILDFGPEQHEDRTSGARVSRDQRGPLCPRRLGPAEQEPGQDLRRGGEKDIGRRGGHERQEGHGSSGRRRSRISQIRRDENRQEGRTRRFDIRQHGQ